MSISMVKSTNINEAFEQRRKGFLASLRVWNYLEVEANVGKKAFLVSYPN